MIYYFSGTGNSQWVAQQLAQLTGDQAADIAPLIQNKVSMVPVTVKAPDRIGLVFPIYAWNTPKIVDEFVAALTVEAGAYAYAVCTCGSDAGRAMEKLKKRYAWNAAWSISMPDNYLPMYDVDTQENQKAKIDAATALLPDIASHIQNRQAVVRVRQGAMAWIKTEVVNPFFKMFALRTRPFTADDVCTGCGLCVRNCPRGIIRLENEKPVWTEKRCLQCMACIQRCPVRAIQYGKGTRAKGRYYFNHSGDVGKE
jgi:ferredoxin